MFNQELAKYLSNYRWSGCRDQHDINDEELNRIVMIMARVAESYDCSTSSGFTPCEAELEGLLTRFYEAGVKRGEEAATRQIIWNLEKRLPN